MASGASILIVDDDERMCAAIDKVLRAENYAVVCAHAGREALDILKAHNIPLVAHAWPGNVRELEHVIQRAVAISTGNTISGFEFSPTVLEHGRPGVKPKNGSELSIPIGTSVDEATRRLVEATVAQCGGNKLQAARLLGIPPRTMYRHFGGPKQ